MNCECGCGAEVKMGRRFVRGHQLRKKLSGVVQTVEPPVVDREDAGSTPAPGPDIETPPVWPNPIDQRRWRIAVERPSTPKTDPWILTRCHGCHLPMWTRDPLSDWEHGGVCEECLYRLMDEDMTTRVKQQNRQAPVRRSYDPFSGL